MAGQPLNATFFAFRKREKSGVLFGASVAYLILAIVLFGAFIAVNVAALGQVISWYGQLLGSAAGGKPASPEDMALPAGVGMFFLSLIPFMFAFYIAFAAYEAACLRWMIRGETGGIAGLSLGGDTWRVYLTYWVWFFLYIGFSLITGIITGALFAGAIMSGGMQNGDLSVMGPALMIGIVVRLAIYIVLIYFGVRLAPAAAISVGRQKFSFFDAWKVTKGRFWSLFGAFFLICIIMIAGEIVVFGVVGGVLFASVLPTSMNSGANADPQQMMSVLASVFTPQNLIVLAVAYTIVMALSLIIYVLFFGVNARAVLAAAEEGKIDGVPTTAVATTFE